MNLSDFLNIIFLHRKRIILVTLIGSILFGVYIYLVSPMTYSSTTSILPPDSDKPVGLGSLLGGGDLSSVFSGGGGNSQLLGEIVKSRSASMYVISKNNLVEELNAKNMDEAVEKLKTLFSIEVTKEGILKITTSLETGFFGRHSDESDKVKKMAAVISNSFAEALDSLNRLKLTSKAKRARIYLDTQIQLTKSNLDSLELELMIFQKDNKAIALTEQVKVSIENAAKIKAEIMAAEIELSFLEENLRENSSQVLAMKSKIEAMKEQYRKLERKGEDYLVSFGAVPELALKLTDLYREVKIQNEVYSLLQQQYYKEQIQENKDISTIEVLDRAIPPYKHSSPRVLTSTILASIFIFLSITIISIIQELKVFSYLRKIPRQ